VLRGARGRLIWRRGTPKWLARCARSPPRHSADIAFSDNTLLLPDMTTEVIYARIPGSLKARVEEYAGEHAMTTTSAVVDLLERGFESVSNARSVARLEGRAAELHEQLGAAAAKLREAEGRVAGLEDKERNALAAYQGLRQRTDHSVGSCPYCKGLVRGYDLFVTGHCSACGKPVSTLLVGAGNTAGLDQKELLLLLGAIGIVVGMAYLGTKG